MVVFPNIKINLGLYITGKRPDGYHNIESIFYPVQWKETLEITDRQEGLEAFPQLQSLTEVGKVRFMSYGIPIPGNADSNLCIKVYQSLEEWFNLPSIDMHLLKTLPIGAGLGGGSADAAFTLKALKDYFQLRLSDVEAKDLLAKIGSDCPFFWENKPMFVYGRGEKMRPIDLDLSKYFVLIVNPNIHISTKEAYSGVKPSAPAIDLEMMPSIGVEGWKDVLVNDFEASVFPKYPIIKEIKERLYAKGALYASMTGSGSTLYGIFEESPSDLEFSQYITWNGKLTF
ncbi:4-(cytidine 5'-diphospho)-2-C-methyl-D-erythritol kinase [Salibacteraceae bacterium]|jgi:4-diphosphocytidyl-2-C-methyl-D-erythritol kinase|nr:4-(cytidine 5'-diphospho)-2-C-methyl-D-erythritol kinase [Salibacteraceae bacterium]